MRIVETDGYLNHGPEQFVNLPPMTPKHAENVAAAINSGFGEFSDRFWKVVRNDYELLK